MGHFKPQELANTAWALAVATLRQKNASLFAAWAKAAERHVRHFNPQDLSSTAWAFATMGQKDASLFAALAKAAERRMRHFNP